jgi:hypothetical protein
MWGDAPKVKTMKEKAKLNVWFPDRNFGFVYWVDKNGKMISHFLHVANVISGRENLRVGAELVFHRAEARKGWLAVEVEVGGEYVPTVGAR